MKLLPVFILYILLFSLITIYEFPVNAASQPLTTFTTPQNLIWNPPTQTGINLEANPSNNIFYPNGTVKISSPFNYMKFAIGGTTSGLANSTYVRYSFTISGCMIQMNLKQNGGNILFSISGTSCPIFTFSFTPKSSASITALNSTWGTSGTICRLIWNAIDWSWCNAQFTAFTISYSAGRITIHNTASNWSFIDPIGLDGNAGCTANAASCNIAFITTISNDVFILFERSGASSTGCESNPPTDNLVSHLTYILRNHLAQGTSEACEYYAIWTSAGSITVTCNQASSSRIACAGLFIKGASTSTIFDPNANALCSKTFSGTNTGVTCTISTSNNEDMLLADVTMNSATVVITVPSGFTSLTDAAGNSVQNNDAWKIVSAIQTNLAVAFSWASSSVGGVEFVDAIMQKEVSTTTTLTESVAITDNINNKNIKNIGSELISITDLIKSFNMKNIGESTGITDSIKSINDKFTSESIAITDSIQSINFKSITDLINITDNLIKANFFQFVLQENIAIHDLLFCQFNFTICVGHALGSIDDSYFPLGFLASLMLLVLLVKYKRDTKRQ